MLPEYAGGRNIAFYDSSPNRGWMIVLIGSAATVLIVTAKDRKIKDLCDRRRKQMERDYSGILNQYMLYYTAGMNPRAIWYAMCQRYEEGLETSSENRRYAYEEMIIARNRMDEGCREIDAYEEFAKRCDGKYRAFICSVKQAAVKGNDGLKEILMEEVGKALREKNNQVKIEASEAETKLLLPMFMMLMVVLAVVMIPALIGLNG